MPISPKPTLDELLSSSQDFLQQRIGTSNFTEGTFIGTIVQLHSQKISEIYDLLTQAESARDIELATGQDLDNLARTLGGLVRRSPTRAGSQSTSPQMLVTNNSVTSLSFPAGTLTWSPGSPSDRFITTQTVNLAASQSAAVFVKAQTYGVSYNIGVGQLTSHNGNPNFTISNYLPVQGGNGAESDEDFRYRISETLKSAVLGGQSSSTGIKLALTALPGVIDVILRPEARGPGTLDCVIVTAGGYLPDDDFLTSCTEEMARVAAAGISVRAISPVIIGVTPTVSIALSGGAGAISQGPIRNLIISIVDNYINSRSVQNNPTQSLSPENVATSSQESSINYSILLGQITDGLISLVGNTLKGITLNFSIGNSLDAGISGDVYARNGEVLRSRGTSVSITYSS